MKIIIPILLIIFGVGGGIFIYVRLSDQTLVERNFDIEGNEISMVIPKNLGYKETVKDGQVVAAFGRGGQDINGIGISVFEPTSPKGKILVDLTDCGGLNDTTVSTVQVKYIDKSVNICDSSNSTGEPFFTTTIYDQKNVYSIGIGTKEGYLDSTEGKEKVEQIIGSFSVDN